MLPTPLAYGIAVGISMVSMLLASRLHPPAAANAVLAFHATTTSSAFVSAVLIGASIIASIAYLARFSGNHQKLLWCATCTVRRTP